jgi:polyhydroxybutyrate depolymerase
MAAARRHHVAVVFPDGLGRAWHVGGGCCGASGRQGVDDVGFVAAVLSDVDKHLAVDRERVFATGMSNGAMLAYRLACDTDLFAAVAPVAGTLLGECPAPRPVSVLHIHGLADASVPFDGSRGTGFAQIDGPPVPSVLDLWRRVDRCPEPTTRTGPAGVTTVDAHCPRGRDVVLITVADAGHQWPGSSTTALQDAVGTDPPSTALDATEVIAAFFDAHPRPASATG